MLTSVFPLYHQVECKVQQQASRQYCCRKMNEMWSNTSFENMYKQSAIWMHSCRCRGFLSDYLLMFIMIPTNGWDDRARTAPVSEICHVHEDSKILVNIMENFIMKMTSKIHCTTWMTPSNYRQSTSSTEAGSMKHFVIASIGSNWNVSIIDSLK